MKKLVCLLFVLALCAACADKIYVPVEKTITETVKVHDTTVVVKLQNFTDTVIVREAPESKTAESHLQNRYAVSDAVYKNGELMHTLSTKEGAADTVFVPKIKEVERVIKEPEIIEVKVKQKFWDKLVYWLQGAFGFLALVLTASFVYSIIKVIREERENG